MRLRPSEIKDRTLRWLADPGGTLFKRDPRLIWDLIDEAYQEIVGEIDKLALPWNHDTAKAETITTTTAQEYELTVEARKIVEVDELNSDGTLLRLPEVDYADRQRQTPGYYVYRRPSSDRFVIGFPSVPPIYAKVKAFYLERLTSLERASDVTAVPAEHHELIAHLAAAKAKIVLNQEAGGHFAVYANGLQKMRENLNNTGGRLYARRMSA